MLIKKNYANLHFLTAQKNTFISKLNVSKQSFFSVFLLLTLLFTFSNATLGQVSITKPNLNVTAYCTFPSNYGTLGNIVIRETNDGNFLMTRDVNYTLVLSAPANFEFRPSTGSISYSTAGDISSASITINSSAITINYLSNQGSATNDPDVLTISGIQIRAINTASSGNITRSGGSGFINGITTGTTFTNTLTSSVSAASPTITTNPNNATIAFGANTSFTVAGSNNPSSYTWEVSTNGGSTWSVISNGGVYSNATTSTLNITAASIAMNGYRYRAKATNGCGTSSNSAVATLTVTRCTPTSSSNAYYINLVQSVGTLNDVTSTFSTGYSNPATAPMGYGNYTSVTIAEQIPNGPINISTEMSGAQFIRVYVDWNNNGSFEDSGELVFTTGTTTLSAGTTFGFIVPSNQAIGNYTLRIKTRRTGESSSFTSCDNSGGGETEDYTIRIVSDCSAKITSAIDASACGTGSSVALTVAGSAGTTGFNWYTSQTGGSPIATNTGTTWNTPSLASTTKFYVTATNGTCESRYRTEIKAIIKPTTNLTFSNATPTVCGENDIIELTAAGGNEEVDLFEEDFENGIGKFTVTSNITSGGADSEWSIKSSTYLPTTTVLWKPATSSGNEGNKFAFTTSDYSGSNFQTNLTTTNNINTVGYSKLYLSFRHYYSYFSGDRGTVEISRDGGVHWNEADIVATFNSDLGSAAKFTDVLLSLDSYVNISTLKFRFRYEATFDDGWAIDDIRLYGEKPLIPSINWTSTFPVDAYTNYECTTPYTAGTPAIAVYIKPTLEQLEQGTYSFTANATLTNGCTISGTVNVTNRSKVWKGTTSNDWNTPSNWTPTGVPDNNTCVIIPSGSVSQIINNPNTLAKNLTVKAPAGNLELQSSSNLTVTDWINVENGATFTVRNNANLVQVNNSPTPSNSGSITMQRTAVIDYRDYVYWSTPVTPFNSANISPTSSNIVYKWIPTTGGTNGFGNWVNGVENMTVGLCYIERGLNNSPVGTDVPFTTNFTGLPNNGSITVPISRGTYTGLNYNTGVSTTPATEDDDNLNMLGNPYPSSISAAAFLTANASNLDGFIRIWTHGMPPSGATPDPFYNNYGYNYSPADYLTWNLSGASSGPEFTGYIAAGQGFMTKMLHTSASTTGLAVFNNSMRNASYTNSEFFRTSNERSSSSLSSGRVWLDLVSPNSSIRTLVAYTDGATNGKDQMYDAQTDLKMTFNIYSLIEGHKTTIQGRSLPFNPDDQVPLAIRIATAGNYSIAIGAVDGLFASTSQNIYLEDTFLNIIHNLRVSPYTFTSTVGEFTNRFILRYSNQTLSTDTFDYNNSVIVYTNNNVTIKSNSETIKEVTVYDALGKTLINEKKIGQNEVILTKLKPANNILIVKITLENNKEVIRKMIY